MTARRRGRTTVAITSLILSLVLAVAACGAEGSADGAAADEEDTWYEDGLRIILATAPGGGLDQNAQTFRSHLAEHFGGQVLIEHIPGGGMSIGTEVASEEGSDCTTILYTVTITHMMLELTEEIDYSIDDFHPLLNHVADPYVFLVPNDAEWETFSEFIEDARENPGAYTVGIHAFADTNVTQLMEMEEQLGVEFNLVLYDGGGPARQSVVSGETDFSFPVLFPSLNIRSDTRAIGYWEDPDTAPDADLSGMYDDSEPLEEQEPDLELTGPGSTYSLWVNRDCFDEYPERYDYIAQALTETFEDPDYLDAMDELGLRDALSVIPGDEFADIVDSAQPGVRDLTERYVLPAIAGER